MKYRDTVVLATKTLGDSGTEVIDLNVLDPITALDFYWSFTLSTGARLIHEPDVFSKIELIDGSDVLMALSGTQIQALRFYEGANHIPGTASNLTSTSTSGYMEVLFGRYLRDPELAFDPKKFTNPQIKVTYNTAAVQALATDVQLKVVARCFDEKVISPIGFLRNWEQHSYEAENSTYKYIDLPTDLVIRKLFLQTKGFGVGAGQLLNELKLSEDNDKRIPFDVDDEWLKDMNAFEFGRCFQYFGAYTSGASYPVWGAICNGENMNFVNASSQVAVQAVTGTGGKFAFAAASTTLIILGCLSGNLPFYVWCYPFGDQRDIADWYDPTGIGSLRLRVYSSTVADGYTFNTILQQLRRY